MVLIIAEKKELAQAISAALPGTATQQAGGVLTQGEYTLTWLSGHILTLKAPEDYDPTLKEWTIEQLPIHFEKWEVRPMAEKMDKFKTVKNLLQQADTVIHAGDPDQEGQLLVDEVLRYCRYKGKVLRLNTSNTTKAGLQKALTKMDDNKGHERDGWSAYARSVADFMVGINMSRLFTCLHHVLLSVGRVQTPTLGLVVTRDYIIENHKKIDYYTISGQVLIDGTQTPIPVHYKADPENPNLTDGKILDLNYATALANAMNGLRGTARITKKIVYEKPPLPFNLVKLQSYCNKRYGMKLEEVMEASQSLRDKYKAITYNRSDCQYLTEEHFAEAPDTMAAAIQNIRYKPAALDMSIKSQCFQSDKVVNHFAIIPTAELVDISKFSEKEKNVYLAIVKYYMAQFMPPAKKEITTLVLPGADGGMLIGRSTLVLDPGYLAIFKEAEEDEQSELSQIPEGDYNAQAGCLKPEKKETKPPPRYTQASLAEDMTCISKYVKDPRIKQILKEKDKNSTEDNGSIGTVATRTPIIKKLLERKFLEEDGKWIKSTPLGRELFRILPDEIKGVDVTAEWWVVCEAIVSGTATPESLQRDVLEKMKHIIANRASYPALDPETVASASGKSREPIGKCPRCGGDIIEGKRGFGCTNWKNGCKFTIWKKPNLPLFKNINISRDQAQKLLTGKSVHFSKLYSPKKDKNFSGDISLDDQGSDYGPNFKLEFDTRPRRKRA